MYKVSVICPVYNSEKYIHRTLNSIINQTLGFGNIELILVDDCSTDSSREIIQKYADKYENIKLYVSKKNHGFPGYGRNLGIKKSSADYVMFIDNDDEYCPHFCEIAYNTILTNSCDVVSTNHLIIHKKKVKKENTLGRIDIGKNMVFIDLNGFYQFKSVFVWNKIFKKSVILKNNIKFVEDRWGEDYLFLLDFYYYANKLICIDYYGYRWYRDGTNLSYFSKKATLGILNSYYDIYNNIDNKYGEIDYSNLFKGSIESTLIRICMSFNSLNEIKLMLLELYEFEKFIKFDEKLPSFWSNIVNIFILKEYFVFACYMLWIIRKIKILFDKIVM